MCSFFSSKNYKARGKSDTKKIASNSSRQAKSKAIKRRLLRSAKANTELVDLKGGQAASAWTDRTGKTFMHRSSAADVKLSDDKKYLMIPLGHSYNVIDDEGDVISTTILKKNKKKPSTRYLSM